MNHKEIIIFGGTTEGRLLSERLSAMAINHTVCVATKYGEMLIKDNAYAFICDGRMDESQIRDFIEDDTKIVIDATHPYAVVVTENIKKAICDSKATYIRVLRQEEKVNNAEDDSVSLFENILECVDALSCVEGNILLTTGSKELHEVAGRIDKSRLFVRVLPSIESIRLCEESGISNDHIIAMHGPFDVEMNRALIRQFDIKVLVTKQSGDRGGYREKLEAAKLEGISSFVIKRPVENEGMSIDDAISHVMQIMNISESELTKSHAKIGFLSQGEGNASISESRTVTITLVGVGMGNEAGLTLEGKAAIEEAKAVFGAKRLLKLADGKNTYDYYLAKDIVPIITSEQITNCVVLFSGDTGFYSGSKAFKKYIDELGENSLHNYTIKTLPGISSISYLSSKIDEPYNNSLILSLHGKNDEQSIIAAARKIVENDRTYVIFSSGDDVNRLAERILLEEPHNLVDIKCYLGSDFSYAEEKIQLFGIKELTSVGGKGLYTACFINKRRNIFDGDKVAKVKRVLIAAASSGSGKTMVTTALLNILKKDNIKVTGYKCGPDYIDPMFHRTVIGVGGGNLDSYFCDEDTLKSIIDKSGYDAAIIEGVMGLYDGALPTSITGSGYDIAYKTKTPIILVVDAKGQGRTVISTIKGMLADDKHKLIKGIILNRMSEGFYNKIRDVIEAELKVIRSDVRIVGFIPRLKETTISSRHLGLYMPDEIPDINSRIDALSDNIRKSCDMDLIYSLMDMAGDISSGEVIYSSVMLGQQINRPIKKAHDSRRLKLAVAMDEAFCFYYQENLTLFNELNVDILYFSPIHDDRLPEGIDGLLLGGGYPENYLEVLSDNKSMRDSIKKAIDVGLPVLAECGGFMYLHDFITGKDDREYEMCHAIEGKCYKTDSLKRFGYVEVLDSNIADCDVVASPSSLIGMKGHEFHYYESTNNGKALTLLKTSDRTTFSSYHLSGSLVAGFMHMYYRSKPEFIYDFVEKMRNGK